MRCWEVRAREGRAEQGGRRALERALGSQAPAGGIDSIVGLGLASDYSWEGEDLVEALRRRYDVRDRC